MLNLTVATVGQTYTVVACLHAYKVVFVRRMHACIQSRIRAAHACMHAYKVVFVR